MIEIFIETSSTSRGYDWFDAKPPIFNDSVKQLVDTEFESLILYRKSDQLILAVTALKSGRTDNRTRPIRNSLIWIADNADNDDEAKKIRAIIYEYLTNKESLEKQIAEAITEKPEIMIDYQKIKAIGNQNNSEIKQDSSQLDLDNKIGNLDNCKKELIEEIKSYSLPEKKDGLLIFITDSKSKETFEEVKPWRGLSNNIPSGGWITLGNRKTVANEKKFQPLKSEKSLTNSNNMEGKQSNLLSIVLAILLIVSNVFWFYQTNQLNQRINELEKKFNEIQTLQLVIDRSKTDVETLKTNLENDIITAKSKFDKAFMEAKKQFNEDILKATSKYETDMNKIKKTLDDSLKKIN